VASEAGRRLGRVLQLHTARRTAKLNPKDQDQREDIYASSIDPLKLSSRTTCQIAVAAEIFIFEPSSLVHVVFVRG
jgi:hypothetical protein